MAKRKKYPKLPNGFGSIKYLGKGRRNPYGVYPSAKEFTLDGVPVPQPAIAYVDDWIKGFGILSLYNNGAYTPGQEPPELISCSSTADIVQSIASEYNRARMGQFESDKDNKTFREVYEEFYCYKFEQDKSRQYSKSTMSSTAAAFKNCRLLHDKTFKDLRHDDLQGIIDRCELGHASLELIVSLFHQLYAYADIKEIIDKDYSVHVKINTPDDDEKGVPFSDADLKILWENKDRSAVDMILIMCYSGYRIKAYENIEINLKDGYFRGGVKTASSKGRTVPIHSAIIPLVQGRMKRNGCLIKSPHSFRKEMYTALNDLGIERHTPHDCRHTFSMLCEKYGVSDNDRKRMLGHSFTNDVTNAIYGHRSIDDLKAEIEKIKVCY